MSKINDFEIFLVLDFSGSKYYISGYKHIFNSIFSHLRPMALYTFSIHFHLTFKIGNHVFLRDDDAEESKRYIESLK